MACKRHVKKCRSVRPYQARNAAPVPHLPRLSPFASGCSPVPSNVLHSPSSDEPARAGVLAGFVVMFQPLPHTHDIICRITETPITLDHAVVECANLQIDFWTPCHPKQALGFRDNGSRQAVPLKLGVNRQIVKPSPMPLVTSHHTRHNSAIEHPYQKPVGPYSEFPSDIFARIVPGSNQVASLP